MYKVLVKFADLLDSAFIYDVGETYPREGYEPTLARIRELEGTDNKLGKKIIEEVVEETATEDVVEKWQINSVNFCFRRSVLQTCR